MDEPVDLSTALIAEPVVRAAKARATTTAAHLTGVEAWACTYDFDDYPAAATSAYAARTAAAVLGDTIYDTCTAAANALAHTIYGIFDSAAARGTTYLQDSALELMDALAGSRRWVVG